jgi:aryl-alcohol dehydrogenase-like predicted oxidoreductase
MFGATGLSVSGIGVGCSRIGGMFTTGSSPADELRMLRQAIDAGINIFDTADLYSHGQSEILVGKAIKGRRADAVVATKGGYVLPTQSRLVGRIKPLVRPIIQATGLRRPASSSGAPRGAAAQDFSPAYLAAAVEASLRRLGTDYIDIYQLHSPTRSVVEAGDFVACLQGLQDQGKIRHFGVAVDAVTDAEPFTGRPGITAIELPFSVIDQRAADGLLADAAARGVGVISRSCFAAGLLVGPQTADELRAATPDWEAVLAFRATASELHRSPKELALQFNLGTAGVAVTLVGMRTPAQLAEIVRYEGAPALTEAERVALVRTS